ncbi:PREDICTED: lymphocyte antigen 6 complex locus protein G6d [Miniopterus natalensis]|uniref:lymphocyte antigen 6 complex locus protein G6d n=1 Tax=Miniopterus natalensis TaxID=291302 RepID=UPI0007A6D00F|nr:PREDICTED: lymphocyte antigen 6 complex locus protein G6d [Miniopterus natalensis]
MNPLFVGLLLGTFPEAILGHCMPCCDYSGRGPSSSCKETETTCGEGEGCGFLEVQPQPGLGQSKLSGNPSVTLPHHYPACAVTHHCHQVKTELVGDGTYTAHRDCCVGDLCSSAVARAVTPACILAAAGSALAWVLPGLWRG